MNWVPEDPWRRNFDFLLLHVLWKNLLSSWLMPPFGRRLQQHLKAECIWNSAKNRLSTAFSNTKTRLRLPCRVSTVKLTTTLTNCIRITDLSNKTGNQIEVSFKILGACASNLLRLQLEGGKGPRARTEPVPPRLPWSQRRKTQRQQSSYNVCPVGTTCNFDLSNQRLAFMMQCQLKRSIYGYVFYSTSSTRIIHVLHMRAIPMMDSFSRSCLIHSNRKLGWRRPLYKYDWSVVLQYFRSECWVLHQSNVGWHVLLKTMTHGLLHGLLRTTTKGQIKFSMHWQAKANCAGLAKFVSHRLPPSLVFRFFESDLLNKKKWQKFFSGQAVNDSNIVLDPPNSNLQ